MGGREDEVTWVGMRQGGDWRKGGEVGLSRAFCIESLDRRLDMSRGMSLQPHTLSSGPSDRSIVMLLPSQ